jgi:hypothetical protein
METKVCSKCNKEKKVCEFGKLKSSKDGYRYFCKECRNSVEKTYDGVNVSERKKKWRENNKEKIKKHYQETKKNILDYQKKYREENLDKIIERRKKYYNFNKKEIQDKTKIYRKNNKNIRNIYESTKKKNNPVYLLLCGMRSRLCSYLKKSNITKKNKTFDIVGCSPEFLKEHLEKQFTEGMCWENRDKWHIDHIIPLSSANTEEELYKLCHYTNLQPLWAEENIKKSNKIVELVKQQMND